MKNDFYFCFINQTMSSNSSFSFYTTTTDSDRQAAQSAYTTPSSHPPSRPPKPQGKRSANRGHGRPPKPQGKRSAVPTMLYVPVKPQGSQSSSSGVNAQPPTEQTGPDNDTNSFIDLSEDEIRQRKEDMGTLDSLHPEGRKPWVLKRPPTDRYKLEELARESGITFNEFPYDDSVGIHMQPYYPYDQETKQYATIPVPHYRTFAAWISPRNPADLSSLLDQNRRLFDYLASMAALEASIPVFKETLGMFAKIQYTAAAPSTASAAAPSTASAAAPSTLIADPAKLKEILGAAEKPEVNVEKDGKLEVLNLINGEADADAGVDAGVDVGVDVGVDLIKEARAFVNERMKTFATRSQITFDPELQTKEEWIANAVEVYACYYPIYIRSQDRFPSLIHAVTHAREYVDWLNKEENFYTQASSSDVVDGVRTTTVVRAPIVATNALRAWNYVAHQFWKISYNYRGGSSRRKPELDLFKNVYIPAMYNPIALNYYVGTVPNAMYMIFIQSSCYFFNSRDTEDESRKTDDLKMLLSWVKGLAEKEKSSAPPKPARSTGPASASATLLSRLRGSLGLGASSSSAKSSPK